LGKVPKKEIEKILGVTESTVYRWIKSGKLKAVRIDGAWLYDKDDAIKIAQESEERKRCHLARKEYSRLYYLKKK
jgi:excisionase family DNA binding protein